MSAEQPIGSNAATKDAPPVGPRPDEQPSQHGRSLVGFYIALGAVVALVGLGSYLWKPLKMQYYERQLLDSSDEKPTHEVTYDGKNYRVGRQQWAAQKLIQCGPASRPILERLLRPDRSNADAYILSDLAFSKQGWALPLVIDYLYSPTVMEDNPGVEGKAVVVRQLPGGGTHSTIRKGTATGKLWIAVSAVEAITGKSFYSGPPDASMLDDVKKAREDILVWWDREGQAKYCGGGK